MLRSLAAAAVALLLSGCATSEDVVDIKYIPNTASVVPAAKPVGLTVVDGRTSDRNRISAKMNGYGMEMAAIRAKQDVRDIVKDALKTEFEERGFHVESGDRAVTVTINRFYNQYETGLISGAAHGDVNLTVSVADAAGNAVYSKTYAGVVKNTVMMAGGSNAAESVAGALRDAANQMFADTTFVSAITTGQTIAKPIS